MKAKAIFTRLLVAVLAVSLLTSCLKDQEDIFEKSPAERMQAYLSDLRAVLEAPEHGWKMYLFPIYSGAPTAGFVYTAKFKDGKVTFMSERDGNKSATSYYALTGDSGPVLCFDTFNSIYHYWATPGSSSSLYTGRGGDVDLVVESVSSDFIKLVGKRLGGIVEMFPLEKDAAEYLAECVAYRKTGNVVFGATFGSEKLSAEYYVNGVTGKEGSTNPYRIIEFSYEDEEGDTAFDDEAFVFLPDRIRFYKPLTYGEVTAREFTVDLDQRTIKPVEDVAVSFGKPLSYRPLESLPGEYTLVFEKTWEGDEDVRTIDVTLSLDSDGKGLVLSGLNSAWSLKMSYDDWSGYLYLPMQSLGVTTTVIHASNNASYTTHPRFCYADYSYFNMGSAYPYAPAAYADGKYNLDASGANFRYNLSGTVYTGCVGQFVWDRESEGSPSFRFSNPYTWTVSNTVRAANSWYLHCFYTATDVTYDFYNLRPETGLGFDFGAKDTEGKSVTEFILPYVYSMTKK